MNKSGPGFGQIFVMIAFALSCFGLLLFLWVSFGGPVPLKPKPYEVNALFKQGGGQLATYSDVRISGVTVGKVTTVKREADGAQATIKIDPKYAPLPMNTQATLRTKTLVGETFVALSYGNRQGPKIPDRGTLPDSQIQRTSQLDEIFDTLDKPTRDALQRFVLTTDKATRGSGANLNDAFGELQPALESGNDLFSNLNRQTRVIQQGVQNLGTVFASVGRQQGAVQEIVRSGDSLLQSTSQVTPALRNTLRILPTFLDETKTTLQTARTFATDANPALAALRPVTPLLQPALRDLEVIAPSLKFTLQKLNPIITRSRRSLPALRRTVNAARPAIDELSPLASQLLPIAQYADTYRREVYITLANVAAASNVRAVTASGKPISALRLSIPLLDSTTLTNKAKPSNVSRLNSYPLPGAFLNPTNLPSFNCDNVKNPPTALERTLSSQGAYPCRTQRQLDTNGVTSQFPKLLAADPSRQSLLSPRDAIK